MFSGFDFERFMERPEKTPKSDCPHGKRMRRLIVKVGKRNRRARDADEVEAGIALLQAGRAYCVARCGGCEITSAMRPPT